MLIIPNIIFSYIAIILLVFFLIWKESPKQIFSEPFQIARFPNMFRESCKLRSLINIAMSLSQRLCSVLFSHPQYNFILYIIYIIILVASPWIGRFARIIWLYPLVSPFRCHVTLYWLSQHISYTSTYLALLICPLSIQMCSVYSFCSRESTRVTPIVRQWGKSGVDLNCEMLSSCCVVKVLLFVPRLVKVYWYVNWVRFFVGVCNRI